MREEAKSHPGGFGTPRKVGRFQLADPISLDAIGETWAGYIEDGSEGGRIVLVTLGEFPEGGKVAAALTEAGRRSSKVRHPNVLAFLEVHQQGPELGFVSEYLDGEPLPSLIRAAARQSAPLPQGVALQIVKEAIDTLATLKDEHPLVVLPGALNPESIFVASFGETMLRQPGVVGTAMRAPSLRRHPASLPYRSPEHLRDPRSISDLADVYSAGVILWEMLAGRPLFGSGDHLRCGLVGALTEEEIASMEQRVLALDVPSLKTISRPGGALHPAVIGLVDRALHREEALRPRSLRELSQAISELPQGLLATSLEISGVVERLVGNTIARRQPLLSEGAPMPVFGSRPPSNRATMRPEDSPRNGRRGGEAPVPILGGTPTKPPSSKFKTRPARQAFEDEGKTTSPNRRLLMEDVVFADPIVVAAPPAAPASSASPGEAPASSAAPPSPLSPNLDSHSPVVANRSGLGERDSTTAPMTGLDVSEKGPKKRSRGWILAAVAFIFGIAGVGYLVLGRPAGSKDAEAVSATSDIPAVEDLAIDEGATADGAEEQLNDPGPSSRDDHADRQSSVSIGEEPSVTAVGTEDGAEKPLPDSDPKERSPGDQEKSSKPSPKPIGSGAFRPQGI